MASHAMAVSDLLVFLHPLPLLIAAAGYALVRRRLVWPAAGGWLGWSVLPVLINSPLWLYGSRLFGWTFGGLGGWMYFYFVLPLNGLLFGILSAPLLETMLSRYRSTPPKLGTGGVLQLLVLLLNLGISSAFGFYTSNLAP